MNLRKWTVGWIVLTVVLMVVGIHPAWAKNKKKATAGSGQLTGQQTLSSTTTLSGQVQYGGLSSTSTRTTSTNSTASTTSSVTAQSAGTLLCRGQASGWTFQFVFTDGSGNVTGPAPNLRVTINLSSEFSLQSVTPSNSRTDSNGFISIVVNHDSASASIGSGFIKATGHFEDLGTGIPPFTTGPTTTVIGAATVTVDQSTITSGEVVKYTVTTQPAGFEEFAFITFPVGTDFEGVSFGGGVIEIRYYTVGQIATNARVCNEDMGPLAVITVNPAGVAISPPTASLSTGGTQPFAAEVQDGRGNPVSGIGVSWTVEPSSLGTITSTGLFTAGTQGGAGKVVATAQGVRGEADVTVTAVTVETIEISPGSASIDFGETQQFTAVAKDGQGQVVNGVSFTWSLQAGDANPDLNPATVGSVDQNGVFTANSDDVSGVLKVVAAAEGKVGTASVTVGLTPDFILIGPDPILLKPGESVTVQAFGYRLKNPNDAKPISNLNPLDLNAQKLLYENYLPLGPVEVNWSRVGSAETLPTSAYSFIPDLNDASKAVIQAKVPEEDSLNVLGTHLGGIIAKFKSNPSIKDSNNISIYEIKFERVFNIEEGNTLNFAKLQQQTSPPIVVSFPDFLPKNLQVTFRTRVVGLSPSELKFPVLKH